MHRENSANHDHPQHGIHREELASRQAYVGNSADPPVKAFACKIFFENVKQISRGKQRQPGMEKLCSGHAKSAATSK
jgi:hypothetical protein